MKHLGFTIQFLLLLISIPLLVYIESTRNTKEKPEQEQETKMEVTFGKKAVASMDPLHSFTLVN